MRPSVVAAWTRGTASTTSPRRTVTLIASTEAGAYVARVARGRSVAPPARPTRQKGADRESGAGAYRDAEDVRPADLVSRGRRLQGRRAAREAVPPADGRRRACRDGAPDERGTAQVRPAAGQGREDAGVPHPVHRRRGAAADRGG